MMMTSVEKIQEWRNTHPGVQVTVKILCNVLNLDTLRVANLQGANLWGANLQGAKLWGANL
ncbi:pentapeptide repeat-containing protein, partial [Trueperella pyogenes]|uniref:pentapeptide repeat-containing protein n=1 Tax=Trueperella pyogenes TaxID=1661 RepID=UPI00345DF304